VFCARRFGTSIKGTYDYETMPIAGTDWISFLARKRLEGTIYGSALTARICVTLNMRSHRRLAWLSDNVFSRVGIEARYYAADF
jgi:hypothetical protein